MKQLYLHKVTFRLLAFLLISFFGNEELFAQCTPQFTYVTLPNGQVNFTNTSTGSSTNTTYNWTFGAGNIPPVVGGGTTALFPTVNYSVSGTYIVTLNMFSSVSPTCNQTYTQSIVVLISSCSLNFTTSPATFSTCNGSAIISAPGMCPGVTYTFLPAANQSSLCAGTYTVLASSSGTGGCCPTATGVVTVPTSTVCNLSASFQTTLFPQGIVNFFSTSTGVIPGATYTWVFGDASAPGSGSAITHTYSSAGSYSAWLLVNNIGIPGCVDSSAISIITPSLCNLTASFITSVSPGGVVQFSNTSAGTTSTSTYSWFFGDGGSGTGWISTHAYPASGTYVATLSVANSSNCVSTFTSVISVTVVCTTQAAFTHTVGSNGVVNFRSASTGTNATTLYSWNFGDGIIGTGAAPTHTYTNSGAHYIKHIVSNSANGCRDSVIQALNITGVPCVAQSGFTLVPSGTPQFWYAIPFYPYNVSSAVWSWGDGSTSNGLYSSHVYSVSATYSICLSVTVSCGASSSFCSSYYIAKPTSTASSAAIYSINVVGPALSTDITNHESPDLIFKIYPNPSDGFFNIESETSSENEYLIRDILGSLIFIYRPQSDKSTLDLTHLSSGIYFISSGNSRSQKIIINR